MKKNADITFENNTFIIKGDLDFSNVMSVYEKSLVQAKLNSELNFNFSNLHSSNSAVIALIIEWIKLSKQENKPVRFTHLSNHIMSITKAAGLDKMFNHSVDLNPR